MRQAFTLGLAGLLALSAATAAETPAPQPLRLAQGLDINDLLKGGTGQQPPETNVPSPADPTGLLRGAAPASPREADVPAPLPAARPVASFPISALAGTWAGRGTGCADRRIEFAALDDSYVGQSLWTDALDGTTVTTRYEARAERVLEGQAHPGDPRAYLAYARHYGAHVTRTDAQGTVLDLIDTYPVTLILARDAEGGDLVLRFAEPVTICTFTRAEQ